MNKLPIEFKKYFWDCDFRKLNFIEHRNFILSRLLIYGDIGTIKFVLDHVSRNEIKNYLNVKGNNALNKLNVKFWNKLVLYNELWTN
ncbi:MAG: hypothetical protein GY936_01310 [Ignavibacteriae bacterium]|nr:hypothetical protein [Ignavibacteriota bacterium]